MPLRSRVKVKSEVRTVRRLGKPHSASRSDRIDQHWWSFRGRLAGIFYNNCLFMPCPGDIRCLNTVAFGRTVRPALNTFSRSLSSSSPSMREPGYILIDALVSCLGLLCDYSTRFVIIQHRALRVFVAGSERSTKLVREELVVEVNCQNARSVWIIIAWKVLILFLFPFAATPALIYLFILDAPMRNNCLSWRR